MAPTAAWPLGSLNKVHRLMTPEARTTGPEWSGVPVGFSGDSAVVVRGGRGRRWGRLRYLFGDVVDALGLFPTHAQVFRLTARRTIRVVQRVHRGGGTE
eukprot:ctg_880.g368